MSTPGEDVIWRDLNLDFRDEEFEKLGSIFNDCYIDFFLPEVVRSDACPPFSVIGRVF